MRPNTAAPVGPLRVQSVLLLALAIPSQYVSVFWEGSVCNIPSAPARQPSVGVKTAGSSQHRRQPLFAYPVNTSSPIRNSPIRCSPGGLNARAMERPCSTAILRIVSSWAMTDCWLSGETLV